MQILDEQAAVQDEQVAVCGAEMTPAVHDGHTTHAAQTAPTTSAAPAAPDAVQQAFNIKAATYDQNRRLLIPDFEEFYSVGIDALAYDNASPRVLDLGGGTGLSTDFLLKRYPQARVTLLDFADEMLSIARERFKDNPNIDFQVGD